MTRRLASGISNRVTGNLARPLRVAVISNRVTGTWRVRCGVVWFVEIPLRDARAALPGRGFVRGISRVAGAELPSLTGFAKGIVTEWTRQPGFFRLAR